MADIEVIPTKTITLPADQGQAILDRPAPAPAGSLVERVAKVVGKDRKYSRAAIHEMAAWLDGQMETGAAHILSEEAGRG